MAGAGSKLTIRDWLGRSLLLGLIGMMVQAASPEVGLEAATGAGPVRIGVFSLFHPRELRLRPAGRGTLELTIGEERLRLADEAVATLSLAAEPGEIEVSVSGDTHRRLGTQLQVTSGSKFNRAPGFVLEVPGKLRREFSGSLSVRPRDSKGAAVLEAVVTMPLETAVASVVAAESPAGGGMEALKAQAVASRSFLAARRSGHVDFDFCDTTHCQFLRSPPAAGDAAARATQETAGLVLVFADESARERTLPAMYARSCGGHTRTLSQIGVQDAGGYPYYAVECAYCRRHPERWRLDRGAGAKTERQRLAWNRVHGWGAIPGLQSGETLGRGVGHGVGLCQLGAADMARRGAGFVTILAHYYPNTRLDRLAGR